MKSIYIFSEEGLKALMYQCKVLEEAKQPPPPLPAPAYIPDDNNIELMTLKYNDMFETTNRAFGGGIRKKTFKDSAEMFRELVLKQAK